MSGKHQNQLPLPILPQSVNGTLSHAKLKREGYLGITIPVYDFMAIGDWVTVDYKGEPHEGPITFPPIYRVTAVAPIDASFPWNNSGYERWKTFRLHYVVRDKNSNEKGESPELTLKFVE